jgi:hypothetical protein
VRGLHRVHALHLAEGHRRDGQVGNKQQVITF